MTTITSLQNPHVKKAVQLRDSRQRKKQGRILIDGVRELARAFAARVELLELFVCPEVGPEEATEYFAEKLAPEGVKVFHVDERVFHKMAFGERAEGVIAVATTPHTALEDLWLPKIPLVAVIEGVEKPGNVGAVVRSADAAGVDAVIVADGRTDLYNPNAIRASLGTLFTQPVCEASTEEVLAWLREKKFSIYVAHVHGTIPYHHADYRGSAAIALGSEALGLSDAWSGEDTHAIRLPMLGVADSLNVSATGAVLFYEALRQRTAI